MELRGRSRAAIAIVALAAIVGCSSSKAKPPVERPASVPPEAVLIERQLTVGIADRNVQGSAEERLLFSMACDSDVLTVLTTKETLYAELPCSRMVRPEDVGMFQGAPVRLTVKTETPGKLLLQSQSGASIEFTTGHAWIQSK